MRGVGLHERCLMAILRQLLLFLAVAFSSNSSADSAKCTIEIEDVTAEVKLKAATKYIVEHTFNFKSGSVETQRKHFDLSDGRYFCTLAFRDPSFGTALSCEKKQDSGHTFVQSDRSTIEEHPARNNLNFRDGKSFFC